MMYLFILPTVLCTVSLYDLGWIQFQWPPKKEPSGSDPDDPFSISSFKTNCNE